MATATRQQETVWERIFGREQTATAPTRKLRRSDIIIGAYFYDADHVEWEVVNVGECPYIVAPTTYARYGTRGAWVYVAARDPQTGKLMAVTEWMPREWLYQALTSEKG